MRYLNARHEYLLYDRSSRTAGPPRQASSREHVGIIARFDIGGARGAWTAPKPSFTLRPVISNGDFEEYRRFHLAREHQRLYRGTDRGKYTLGA